mmetsp:Transcript_18198/g.37870  ORF Transcript_18198/g.37870 Transcript_18198/m.37870 type:complete len:127 (+) Transcript_18198:3-383(+)
MAQGGAPKMKGKGGDSIWGGNFDDEFHVDAVHDRRGILSMANKGPNTNRSQFFITYERQPHLNNTYSAFGKVIGGWDVLDAMERSETGEKDKPLKTIEIKGIVVHSNPMAEEGIVYESKDGPPRVG